MLKVKGDKERVKVGERVSISFQRTLRIPEDDQSYPLPPSLGPFEIERIEDYRERVPPEWLERGGYFIAMYQREALWIGFAGADWKPHAIKVSIGGVNAISGTVWEEGLHVEPQDYIVCPEQPWLDGINAGSGFIRQFVAAPLGQGLTVEAQLTGTEEFGGLQLAVYEPKPGVFPESPPPAPAQPSTLQSLAFDGAMGLGAGGKIKQKIYPDEHGIETWDQSNHTTLFVHILNSEQYAEVTGREPPRTPVSAETYIEYGLPWFELYDESKADLSAPSGLAGIKTIEQKESESSAEQQQQREGKSPEGEEKSIERKRVEVEKLPIQKLGRVLDDRK